METIHCLWLTLLGGNDPMEVSSAFCFVFFNLFGIKYWSLRTPQKLGSFWEIQCSMNIDTVLLWSDLGCHILHSFDRTKYIDTWDEILFYENPSILWTVPLVFVLECSALGMIWPDTQDSIQRETGTWMRVGNPDTGCWPFQILAEMIRKREDKHNSWLPVPCFRIRMIPNPSAEQLYRKLGGVLNKESLSLASTHTWTRAGNPTERIIDLHNCSGTSPWLTSIS